MGNWRRSSAAKLLSGDMVPEVNRKLRTDILDRACIASPGMKHLHPRSQTSPTAVYHVICEGGEPFSCCGRQPGAANWRAKTSHGHIWGELPKTLQIVLVSMFTSSVSCAV